MSTQKRISGISTALVKSHNMVVQSENALFDEKQKREYTIKIANTLEEREAAFKLGYKVYLEKGYTKENQDERLICDYDFNENTVILIVQDKEKNVAGTATLVFDKNLELPANKMYHHEINTLKKSGKKTAEICRFAINSDCRNSKEILILLFNYVAIYTTRVKFYDGLAIEVTPRHKNYYKGLLHFIEIGTEKRCPQVQGTVGVLLYLSSEYYQSIIEGATSTNDSQKGDRSIYPHFLRAEQEELVASYLEKQTKAMGDLEKSYFGFSEKEDQNVYLV